MSSAEGIERGLAGSELVVAVRAALGGRAGHTWVVGGAIRDALAGEEIVDLDLAVGGEPGTVRAAAEQVANALGGTSFELSHDYETWRAVGAEGAVVDIAALRAATIADDLRLRDFTVNAIAVPLLGGEPIDPSHGVADLGAGILRAVSPASFSDDPLRVLRAARIAAAADLEVEGETLQLGRACAKAAADPAGERRYAELRLMMSGPDPLRALQLLDELGATAAVLPDLQALRGVEQSANHHLDVYEHTIEVLRRWLAIEADLGSYAGAEQEAVAAMLAEPLADGLSRRDGIRFAAVLHDVGKPATRIEQGGLVSFRGHDRVGAEMVRELCAELRTSRRFAEYQAALTRHHLVLGFMVREQPLPRRRVFDYLERTGGEALDVTLLTVADRLSAQGSGVPEAAIEGHLELAREMITEIVRREREGLPAPLLGGQEIISLLGVRGGRVGEAVRELAAAQFAGEVADRTAAEAHLVAWNGSGPGPGTRSE